MPRLTSFDWSIFLLAGDNQYDPLVPATQPLFGSPDGLWCDDEGRLWIQTDISNSSQNRQDRGYDRIANNMMLVANPATGELKRFLTGPRGCEVTGVVLSPDALIKEVSTDVLDAVKADKSLKAGDTNQQAEDFIVRRYGEFVLLRPVFGLHTLLLWATPLLAVLLGGFGIWRLARRRAPAPERGLSPAEEAEVAALLKRD